MQQLHGAQDSDITLDAVLTTDESDHDTACQYMTQDENVITLASLSKPVTDDQIDCASTRCINVDTQTVFAVAPDPARNGKIYIAGSILVFAAAAIGIPVFYFSYIATQATGAAPSAMISQPAADDITLQIDPVAGRGNDKAGVLTPSPIPDTADKEHEDLATEAAQARKQINSGQHEDEHLTFDEDIVPASTQAVTTSYAFKSDMNAAAVMNYTAESAKEEIHIIRGKAQDRAGELINAAYDSYVAGNYSDAAQAYLGVLQGMPDHRNALLGMAAISLRTGDPDKAGRIWLQVLADHPDDPVATTALIDLMAAQDYSGGTRIIRKLLQDYPHTAFLYFTLGNLQAAASEWTEARDAFAVACRLERDNPDYAYNLAVSLEHAGDWRAALDMYKTALELAHDRPVHFNDSEILARITVLSEIPHGR